MRHRGWGKGRIVGRAGKWLLRLLRRLCTEALLLRFAHDGFAGAADVIDDGVDPGEVHLADRFGIGLKAIVLRLGIDAPVARRSRRRDEGPGGSCLRSQGGIHFLLGGARRGGGFAFALEFRKERGLIGEIGERSLGEILIVVLDERSREERLGLTPPEVAGLAQDGPRSEARLGIDPEMIVSESLRKFRGGGFGDPGVAQAQTDEVGRCLGTDRTQRHGLDIETIEPSAGETVREDRRPHVVVHANERDGARHLFADAIEDLGDLHPRGI